MTQQQTAAAVQTRAMVAKESKPPKPLKGKSVPGLDIGPEELKVKQKADESLKKYWELVDKPNEDGKPQFFEKKGILYRRYFGRRGEDAIVQLVVPKELREKVVSLARHVISWTQGTCKDSKQSTARVLLAWSP